MHTPAAKTSAPRTTARTYRGTTDRIRAVRCDLRDLLAECPSADDVILCASELATNAILHSRSGLPGGSFSVRLTIGYGNFVRVDVEDDGGPWAPGQQDPVRHHGLDIVRALALACAVHGDDGGRMVRATLNWSPQSD